MSDEVRVTAADYRRAIAAAKRRITKRASAFPVGGPDYFRIMEPWDTLDRLQREARRIAEERGRGGA